MLLQLKNVSKIYQIDHLTFYALKEVNLEIKKGEFISIMGPSGSGKSTLMHIIGCLDTPTQGEVIFEGQDISRLNEQQLAKIRNQKIGFIFQSFNLLRRTSVLNNVSLPLLYSPHPQEKKHVLGFLKSVGLESKLNNLPSQLSGGEQQRVAIARALVNHPSIILADEPTGNLDSKTGLEIMNLFADLNKKGNTLVIVTHDPLIAQYAQKIIKIHDGKIV